MILAIFIGWALSLLLLFLVLKNLLFGDSDKGYLLLFYLIVIALAAFFINSVEINRGLLEAIGFAPLIVAIAPISTYFNTILLDFPIYLQIGIASTYWFFLFMPIVIFSKRKKTSKNHS